MDQGKKEKLEQMLVEIAARAAAKDVTHGELERLEKQIRVIKMALA